MTIEQFNGLQPGDVLKANGKDGKTWVVSVSEANAFEAGGRYVYAERCNASGTKDGLTNRERACGVAIRTHVRYELVNRVAATPA